MARPRLKAPRFRLKYRQRRGVWTVYWTEDGQTKSQSTGCRSREDAEEFLAGFIASWSAPEEPVDKTVAAVIDGYLEDRKGQIASYDRRVELANNLKARLGWMKVDAIRPSTSRVYTDRHRQDGLSDGTIRLELGALRAALRWAVAEQWIGKAPVIRVPPSPPPRDRWLTREEADRLVAACRSHHVKLFVLLALHTAARKSAILELRWPQVSFIRRQIDFNPPARVQTTKKRPVVPINDTLFEVLTEAFELRQTDHVVEWNGNPAGNIKKAFERTAKRAGLVGVTPHVLRHTAASWMAMAGVDMHKIQRFFWAQRSVDDGSNLCPHASRLSPGCCQATGIVLLSMDGKTPPDGAANAVRWGRGPEHGTALQ